jgi:ABC-type glycerol-3-phosphate transport system substrate-binding protein
VVAASIGGMAAILAAGRAHAFGQTTSLQWLKFVDFVPVSDQLLRGKITEECQKALGIKLNVETIEGNGIQARITSAIQSGTGPDIIMAIKENADQPVWERGSPSPHHFVPIDFVASRLQFTAEPHLPI